MDKTWAARRPWGYFLCYYAVLGTSPNMNICRSFSPSILRYICALLKIMKCYTKSSYDPGVLPRLSKVFLFQKQLFEFDVSRFAVETYLHVGARCIS